MRSVRAETIESYRERVLRVLVHIQGRLDEPISLEELAGVANFSPYHFHRIFRGMVGESVKEHVRRLRVERAAQRLRTARQTVLEIALDAGYETHESFTRAFAAMFGDSPSAFRKNHSRQGLGRSPSGVHFAPDGKFDFQPAQERRSPMEVSIKRMEKIRLAFIRHVGPYEDLEATWQKLMAWAGPKGLLGPNVRIVGVSHDDPEITPPEKLRYDAAVEAPDGIEAEGEVGIQEIAPGDYAVTTHRGPYQTLVQTYARLCGEWLPASGRELKSGPALEFYLNSPENTPPEELLTDIYMPLA